MESPSSQASSPLSEHAKTSLVVVFLVIFLDLVSFSLIFPMFPAMAKFYLATDGDNYFLRLIFDNLTAFYPTEQGATITPIVLFGGVLAAVYSLLQFICTPIWGGLSDRYGRKPILAVCIAVLAASYALWFVAASFTILILGRFIGGIASGNISTATAVVADVTSRENRSKGMAIIGIAFALGFIIGPAMGGALAMIDLTEHFPSWTAWGVNPFSVPAAVSFLLSAFNLWFLAARFEESLPPEKRGDVATTRTANPLRLFQPLPHKGVNLTNFGHLLFLAAFSGMEFTLTFLAVERLAFTPLENGYMFIFIGFIIAFVQGGVVRRKAHEVGEKKMALIGLITLIPGMVAIGLAQGVALLYLGLFFLAVGSAMAIPCLTSLVSLYTPSDVQGQALGLFRSLGALGRVVGPAVACVIYWKYGAAVPYYVGAGFLVIPIAMVAMLPVPEGEPEPVVAVDEGG